jgi:hypothetical protein
MIENQFVVTRLSLRAHKKESFESFQIVGKKGNGKTVYATKVMGQIFMAQGLDEDSAYEQALNHLLFSKQDITNFLHKYSGDQQPVVCFDDVRSNLSAMSYISFPLQTQLLLGLCDCARDSVASILTTSPSTKGVLSFLKREQGYQVLIHKDRRNNWRIAKGYMKFEIPSGIMRIKPRFIDSFHFLLPNWVYERVKAKRKMYKDILVKSMEERISKLAQKDVRLTKELEDVKKLGTI